MHYIRMSHTGNRNTSANQKPTEDIKYHKLGALFFVRGENPVLKYFKIECGKLSISFRYQKKVEVS